MLDDYPDGVWFVDLAPMTDERLVPQAVASVLGVKEEAGHPVLEALVKYVTRSEAAPHSRQLRASAARLRRTRHPVVAIGSSPEDPGIEPRAPTCGRRNDLPRAIAFGAGAA